MQIGIDQVCTFFIDGQMFGIDVRHVQEVIRYQEMTSVPLAPRSVCGLINLRGQIVTAVDFRKRIGMPENTSSALPMNVVIRSDDGAVSLLVDRIGDVQQVDPCNLELPPETLAEDCRRMVSATYKLNDRLFLILDIEKVLKVS